MSRPAVWGTCRATVGARIREGAYHRVVYATGWHNGSRREDPAGYGLKFVARDRDRHFDPNWSEVVVTLENGPEVRLQLSPSFWRTCSEIRSAEVGRWLLEQGAAPWPASSPLGIVVTPEGENRFSARILRRKQLPTAR